MIQPSAGWIDNRRATA